MGLTKTVNEELRRKQERIEQLESELTDKEKENLALLRMTFSNLERVSKYFYATKDRKVLVEIKTGRVVIRDTSSSRGSWDDMVYRATNNLMIVNDKAENKFHFFALDTTYLFSVTRNDRHMFTIHYLKDHGKYDNTYVVGLNYTNVVTIDAVTKEVKQYNNCTGIYKVVGGVEFTYVENGEVMIKRYTNKKGAVA